MILGIIIGLFVGVGLGMFLMAAMVQAHEEDERMTRSGDMDYSHCNGCKYEDLSSWDAPCNLCHGEYYEPYIEDE